MDFKPFIQPRELVADKDTLTETFGRFYAEPFERGFGTTIGNSLRRILLSSVQGAAVVAIQIADKNHEFDTIEGVVEDISDIILNLRGLKLRLAPGIDEVDISVNKEHSGDSDGQVYVTGADFLTDGGKVEIINPDHVVATLSKGGALRMDARVQLGRGYELAAQIKQKLGIGDYLGPICVDAVFSPIMNVRYAVEAARVGQRTDYDRLIMEITTNGTVKPEDALSYSAKVLRDHLHLFISMKDQAEELAQQEEEQRAADAVAALEEKLDKSIEELELSVRSYNCLEAAGIKTIRDLVQKTEGEMLRYRNFGRKSLNEIKAILKEMGLRFGMEIDRESGLPVEFLAQQNK
jgi:DNA-directed RNA polymerase subunit alpha